MGIVVGNGTWTKFWLDTWDRDGPLKDSFSIHFDVTLG